MELGRAWGGMQELGEIYNGYNTEIEKLKVDLTSAEAKAKTAADDAVRASSSVTKAIEELSAEQATSKKLAEEVANQSALLKAMEKRERKEADKNWQIGWDEAIKENYQNVVKALDVTYADGWRAALKEAGVPPESPLWSSIPAYPKAPAPPADPSQPTADLPEDQTAPASTQEQTSLPPSQEEPLRVEDYVAADSPLLVLAEDDGGDKDADLQQVEDEDGGGGLEHGRHRQP